MPSDERQFKILLADEVQVQLEEQRLRLGFHSGNSLAAIYVTAFSDLPTDKVWEALAMIRRYKKDSKLPRRNSF
jgi:hypothetical protein